MKTLVAVCLISLLLLITFPTAYAQETFDWELARPFVHTPIDERVEGSYSDGVATVGLGVNITDYLENSGSFGGRDVIGFMIAATANTREIITYDVSPTPYRWYDVDESTCVTGDDESRWIAFPYPVRFYGGRRSAEYYGVYVCSNGFVTFDSNPTDRYYGRTIPSEDGPDTFIAPFWTDLKPNQGGSITWGYSGALPGYVISWNEVPNKYGMRQTFQIVIEYAPGSPDIYRNSKIWFNYQSVTLDDDTTLGIEDQRGLRGVSYNCQDLGNRMGLKFQQASNLAFIQYLTIKLNRGGDQYALIDVDPGEDGDWARGENVELRSSEPDYDLRWLFALAGLSALCMEYLVPGVGWVKTAGIILNVALVGLDIAEVLALSLSPAEYVEVVDDFPTLQPESRIKVAAIDRSFDYFTCVDAAVGVRAWWIFTDPNDQDHELTITAELTYAVYDKTGVQVAYETIPTSVDLGVFASRRLSISATSGGETDPAPGNHTYDYGSIVSVAADPWPLWTLDYWVLDGEMTYGNPIDVTMNTDHAIKAYFRYTGDDGGGGGGGGPGPWDCPYSTKPSD